MIAPGSSFSYVGILPRLRQFVYDAIAPTNRRAATRVLTMSEDDYLGKGKRRKLNATTRDVHRNFVMVAWAIRKHLDYVTQFTFQAKTPDRAFNQRLEAFVAQWGRRTNYDLAGRHRQDRLTRIAEARRIVDGDILLTKILGIGSGRAYRGTIQAIEADRITSDAAGSPTGGDWIQGVRIDANGRALEYAVAKRGPGGRLIHDKRVRADNAVLHGFWDATQRVDQVRGIGPLTQALNTFRDTYHGFDLALANLRIQQLFALKITRDQYYDDTGEEAIPSDPTPTEAPADAAQKYEVDMTDGPVKLELERGEDADFLQSRTPSTETVAFLQLLLEQAIKSLDLPKSFFDESSTNFFGSRGALLHYLRSAKNKQNDNAEALDELTAWRVALGVYDGELELPRGMLFDDILWEYVPDGVPWWDPAKEVKGHAEAVAKGFDNPQHICRMNGTDFYDNVDAIADAINYATERGVPLDLLHVLEAGPAPPEPAEQTL